jgi:type IV pilus assembly protein PilP
MLLHQKGKTQSNNLLAGTWQCLLLGCAFFICLATGCNEPPPSPKKEGVVRQKIAVQKSVKAKPADSKKDSKGSEKDTVKDAKVPAKPVTTTEPKEQKGPAGLDSEAVQEEAIPSVSKESQQPTNQPVLEKGEKIIKEPVTKEKQEIEMPVYSYNPVGKIDPFRPILSDRADGGPSGPKKRPERTAPLTPLQKIDINQVSLVGIIVSPKGNTAMVQDASGKGYIIAKGTYIGTNFGKVVKVLKDKVVVNEEVEDYISGRIKTREVTLELPKQYDNGSMQ